jgi:hypothetical protein
MITDLTIMRDRLRKETAQLLGLDVNNLTATQSIRLDRAATLRLELDDIESRKLQGATFDAVKYIAVSEALERMLGGNPEQPNNSPDFSGAREELANFLVKRAERIEQRDSKLRDEIALLMEENAKLRDKLAIPVPGGGDARCRADTHMHAQPLAAAGSSSPSKSATNVIQIDATPAPTPTCRRRTTFAMASPENPGAMAQCSTCPRGLCRDDRRTI